MNKGELRKRSRLELLELLQKEMQENERLTKRVTELEAQLNDRKIVMENSGTLAEAAMKLAGVFEAADEAIRLYQESIGYEKPNVIKLRFLRPHQR